MRPYCRRGPRARSRRAPPRRWGRAGRAARRQSPDCVRPQARGRAGSAPALHPPERAARPPIPPPDWRRGSALPRRKRPRGSRSPGDRAVPLLPFLALDAEPRVGDRPETLAADRLGASFADPVRPGSNLLEGLFDHLQHALDAALEGELLLPFKGLGRDVHEIVLVPRSVGDRLLLGLDLVLLHLGELLLQPLPLVQQQAGELFDPRAAPPLGCGPGAPPGSIRRGRGSGPRRPATRRCRLSRPLGWHLPPPCRLWDAHAMFRQRPEKTPPWTRKFLEPRLA